jgi:plasmid stabilization system protein ParE
VRKIAARRYPYLIYYRADEVAGEIVILAIRHSARAREHADA